MFFFSRSGNSQAKRGALFPLSRILSPWFCNFQAILALIFAQFPANGVAMTARNQATSIWAFLNSQASLHFLLDMDQSSIIFIE